MNNHKCINIKCVIDVDFFIQCETNLTQKLIKHKVQLHNGGC